MATLNITATELDDLVKWKDAGRVADAWNFLGSKGDAYAFLAGAIVSDNVAAMSPIARLFYEMVRSQWENTVGAGVWGGAVFKGTAQRHLENYLKLLKDNPASDGNGYTLPNTIQIEASYKDAEGWYGIPPITAIDSLFSVLDLAAGNGNGELLKGDFSWAQVMDLANSLMGGPRWQAERIKFNSKVFESDVDPVTAVVTLGRTVINSLERYGAGAAAQITFLAPAYWTFKLVDGALDFTMMDFARRQAAQVVFKRMDATLTTETMDTLLDAAGIDDRVAFGTLIDRLAKVLKVTIPESNANRAQIFDNVKTLSDWRKSNLMPLSIQSFTSLGTDTLSTLAKTSPDALAYRYALKELNPFAVLGADYSKFNTAGELNLYDKTTGQGEITEQYLADRAQFLAGVLDANLKDTGTGKALRTEVFTSDTIYFKDDASGISVQQQNPLVSINAGPKYLFGGTGNDTLWGSDLADHLYGGAGSDRLDGGKGADYLEGNAGADNFTGGAGNDTLIGGAGLDIYTINDGDGWDTIEDSDGQGAIYYDDTPLTGGDAVGDSGVVWQKTENGKTYTYILVDWTEGGETYQRLSIEGPEGGMFIKRWQPGQLGIKLPDAQPVTKTPAIFQVAGGQGTLFGGDAADNSITGGASSDVLAGGFGADKLEGGGGQDFIWGDMTVDARDVKSDWLIRVSGPNELHLENWAYDTGQVMIKAPDDPTLYVSHFGIGNDNVLKGCAGDDYFFGGGGNDLIEDDVDRLFGDAPIASGVWVEGFLCCRRGRIVANDEMWRCAA